MQNSTVSSASPSLLARGQKLLSVFRDEPNSAVGTGTQSSTSSQVGKDEVCLGICLTPTPEELRRDTYDGFGGASEAPELPSMEELRTLRSKKRKGGLLAAAGSLVLLGLTVASALSGGIVVPIATGIGSYTMGEAAIDRFKEASDISRAMEEMRTKTPA